VATENIGSQRQKVIRFSEHKENLLYFQIMGTSGEQVLFRFAWPTIE